MKTGSIEQRTVRTLSERAWAAMDSSLARIARHANAIRSIIGPSCLF
jgi:hypothetical protein